MVRQYKPVSGGRITIGTKMLLYDKVKKLLTENEKYRDNDLHLYARLCVDKGLARVEGNLVSFSINAILHQTIPFGSVERARRKVQQDFPTLRGKNYQVKQQLAVTARESFGDSVVYSNY